MKPFDALLCDYYPLADAKWLELLGEPAYISPWNPRMTAALENDQRREAQRALAQWTEAWFAKRGAPVTCEPNKESYSLAIKVKHKATEERR